ncbi:MAG: diguanylate cyclase [Desulforhabdus sp.]|nr:diguanylate cyclase [Desulforhabdus sp.]
MKTRAGTKAQLIEELAVLRRRVEELQATDKRHYLERDYLENVLENSPDAIGIVDRKGRFIKWNRMAEEIFGFTFEELKGKSSFDLYANTGELRAMLVKLRASGSIKNYEINMKKKDGSILPIEVSISLLLDNDDRLVGSVCVARNLADLKRALNALEKSNAQLHEEISERRRALEALEESQNQYRAIFENTGNATVIIEEDTLISLANTEFVKLSGYSKEEIEGRRSWTEFFAENDLKWMREYHRLRRIDPHAAPRNYEACFKNRQGEPRVVYVTIATIPSTMKSVASFLDITERKRTEEALRRSNKELEQHSFELYQLNEMLDVLQVCNTSQEIYATIGHFATKLFPIHSGFLAILGETQGVFNVVATWGSTQNEKKDFSHQDCWALRRGKAHVVEMRGGGLLCGHLSCYSSPVGYLCIPMIARGEVVGLFHLMQSAGDPAEQSADSEIRLMSSRERLATAVTDHIGLALANLNLRETLRLQSIRDPLTGLFNRRFMEESLLREISWARRHDMPLAIIMLDVDHFKQFNDTYGHEAGDLLLTQVGSFLKSHIREEDIACRYGGEEFVLILPGASLEAAEQRAEHLREKIKELHLQYQGKPLAGIMISVGLAGLTEHHASSGALLKDADTALYRAKSAGRDRVVVAKTA